MVAAIAEVGLAGRIGFPNLVQCGFDPTDSAKAIVCRRIVDRIGINAFLGLGGADYVDHAAQMTNSCSLQPPKTSTN